jgi:hypothetical protein
MSQPSAIPLCSPVLQKISRPVLGASLSIGRTSSQAAQHPKRTCCFIWWGFSADINDETIGRQRSRLPRDRIRIQSRSRLDPETRQNEVIEAQYISSLRKTSDGQLTADELHAQHTMASIARSALLKQATVGPVARQSVIARTARVAAFHTTARRNLLPPLPRTQLHLPGV